MDSDCCTPMFVAALFKIQNVETVHMSIERGMDKNIYTYNGILALKKEILIYAVTWKFSEDIRLSKIIQSQMDA